jgi:uncharacterized protein DUF4232
MNQPSFWFSLTNTGRPCLLKGYPGIELVDRAGRAIDVDIGRGGGFIFEDPGPRDVTLGTQAKGWFVISSVAVCGADVAPESAAVLVIPPDERRQLRIDAQIPYCPPSVRVSAIAADEGALHLH